MSIGNVGQAKQAKVPIQKCPKIFVSAAIQMSVTSLVGRERKYGTWLVGKHILGVLLAEKRWFLFRFTHL